MARRKKSSPAEDLIEVLALLPWWAGVALALLSYLLLHKLAAQPIAVASQAGHMSAMVTQGLWKGLASAGQRPAAPGGHLPVVLEGHGAKDGKARSKRRP